MIKLLRVGVRRYLHSIVFWLAFIVTVAVSLICSYQARNNYLDDIYIMVEFITFAVMISWLVGRECDEGIFRNKVVAGHMKDTIFLSELILGTGACSVLYFVFAVVFACMNSYVFSVIPFGVIAKIFLDCFLVNICFAAILVTVSCLFHHRAVIAIVNIVLTLGLVFASYGIENVIGQPEYITVYEYQEILDDDGDTAIEEEIEYQIPNANYIGGPVLKVCRIIHDIVPYCHITEYITFTYDWFGYTSYDSDVFMESGVDWESMVEDIKITEESV